MSDTLVTNQREEHATDRHQILRWSRFAGDSSDTGPCKRSAQIAELAQRAGFAISEMVPPARTPFWPTRWAGVMARWRFGKHASVDLAGVGLLGFRTLFYRRALAQHRGLRLLLWETTYDDLLPHLARKAGFKSLALPHNLEAFVSEPAFANPNLDVMPALSAEVRRLGRADAIYTISREERWLLETRGLTPGYLPFYPTSSVALACNRLRVARESRARPDGHVEGPLLLVGSAFNPATCRGMRLQLRLLKDNLPNVEVLVAGPRTDDLLAEFRGAKTTLLGAVSRERLEELMRTASSLLIHTESGAGAVTRIPEAIIAGIPVVANANAARDQYEVLGVHVYESSDDFCRLASSRLPIPPPLARPDAAEQRFVATLQSLARTSSNGAGASCQPAAS